MDERQRDLLIQKMRGDISNALAATEVLIRLIREKGSEKHQLYLAMLHQSLYQEMRTILHLELTRQEPPAFRPRTADLAKLVLELGRQVEGLADRLGIRFTLDVEPESLITYMDSSLVETAVLALVSNALSAAGKGGCAGLRLRVQNKTAILTVTDDGPGLADPSRQEDALLPDRGLGLGLQAARRAAQLHKGALVLEDAEGRGVKAVLSLPITGSGKNALESPRQDYLLTGGYTPVLIELSDLLPPECFLPEDTD